MNEATIELEDAKLEETSNPCIDHGQRGNNDGYGKVWHEGKHQSLHRLAYCKHHGLSIGEIAGLVVRHICDNSRCVNPDHLLLGTQDDNMRDKAERRRGSNIKLTVEQVEEIRATCRPNKDGDTRPNPYGYNALGRKFGVDGASIRMVYLGVNHKATKPKMRTTT